MGEDLKQSIGCMAHGTHTLWHFSPVESDKDGLQKGPGLCENLTHLGHIHPLHREGYLYLWVIFKRSPTMQSIISFPNHQKHYKVYGNPLLTSS